MRCFDRLSMIAGSRTKLEKLESKLDGLEGNRIILEPLLEKGLSTLFNVDSVYEHGSIERKREPIGSMFPEKLTFDGKVLRTTRINEAAEAIYLINSNIQTQKKRKENDKTLISA